MRTTTVYVTHHQIEALSMGDRIAFWIHTESVHLFDPLSELALAVGDAA